MRWLILPLAIALLAVPLAGTAAPYVPGSDAEVLERLPPIDSTEQRELRNRQAALRQNPLLAQASLTRAAILQVQDNYAPAHTSCIPLLRLHELLTGAGCIAGVTVLLGRPDEALRLAAANWTVHVSRAMLAFCPKRRWQPAIGVPLNRHWRCFAERGSKMYGLLVSLVRSTPEPGDDKYRRGAGTGALGLREPRP